MARYGDVDSTTRASLSGHEAKSDINGYSLGVYGTWYANHADKSGLYLDGWLLWSDLHANIHGEGIQKKNMD